MCVDMCMLQEVHTWNCKEKKLACSIQFRSLLMTYSKMWSWKTIAKTYLHVSDISAYEMQTFSYRDLTVDSIKIHFLVYTAAGCYSDVIICKCYELPCCISNAQSIRHYNCQYCVQSLCISSISAQEILMFQDHFKTNVYVFPQKHTLASMPTISTHWSFHMHNLMYYEFNHPTNANANPNILSEQTSTFELYTRMVIVHQSCNRHSTPQIQ
jgi:hypothetical protein